MIKSDAPSYTFNGRLAQDIGLDAAVLHDVLMRVASLQAAGADGVPTRTLSRLEDDWLALVPFLSPGRFLAALDRLVDTGLVVATRPHTGGREITLPVSVEQRPEPEHPPYPWVSGPDDSAAAPSHSDDPSDDAFDMPPPVPETRLLTDGQDKVRTSGHRPRYSDQPLYMRGQEQTSASNQDKSGRGALKTEPATPATGPSAMSLEWQPSQDCLRMIEGKGIETDFALAQRESFVLYYRDSGQRHISWDTKFLNWVSRRWQYHLNDRQHDSRLTENSPGSGPDRRQKLRSRLRNIGDFDW